MQKMTIIQSISTFVFIGLFGSFQYLTTNSHELQNSGQTKIIEELQGTWIHTEDSLATVRISDTLWTFIYQGESTPTDLYEIKITNSLPKYVDPKKNSEFLILINENDTLEYEIFAINDTILSLMYFPRGNMQVYKRKKK